MESILHGVEGFMYPNEMELQWSILIVLYPFITGLVAGAFILASLERVFSVEAVKPTYRLALLTALAFLLVAPLPLQLHLGHPERSLEMYLTPHTASAMAMFGFVYLWYLMAVLLLEIWLDYRKDIVRLAQTTTGPLRLVYRLLTLGSYNVSEEALRVDDRVGTSSRSSASPRPSCSTATWGSSSARSRPTPGGRRPLMPIVFLFSAIVSGHRRGDAALHGRHLAARRRDRHALRGHHRALPLLRLHHRLLARDARPDPPHLRGRRVVPDPRLHGEDAALHAADHRADRPRDAGAARAPRAHPGGQAHRAGAHAASTRRPGS